MRHLHVCDKRSLTAQTSGARLRAPLSCVLYLKAMIRPDNAVAGTYIQYPQRLKPMIVRSPFKCATCGQVHTVRIGMGQETRQTHRFPCVNCGEDMVVALNVDYQAIAHWTEGVENAGLADESPGTPIVNLDANFLVPENERHLDRAFPRLTQVRERIKIAEKRGSLALLSRSDIPPGMLDQRPFRRPDYAEEWELLRKTWALHRRGRDDLARQKFEAASALRYNADPLHDLLDWLWRFATFIGQPHYDPLFLAVVELIRPLLRKPEFADFVSYYNGMASDRSDRYFEVMKAYFESYDDFGQVHFHRSSTVRSASREITH
jgi:hypothetical protein